MNQRLTDLYANVSVHATAQREHEAAIELLLLMMVADHHVGETELDEIRAISEDSGLETDTFSFDQYKGQALATVRSALSTTTRPTRCSTTSTSGSPTPCSARRCSRPPATWPASTASSTPPRRHCSVRSPPASADR